MKYHFLRIAVLILCWNIGFSQTAALKLLTTNAPANASFRGMSIVTDNVIWVSGSKGNVGRSADAGKTWQWMVVKNFEKIDFRDIHAFDSMTAIIMAIDNPANILKTTDGGASWKVVYTKTQQGMFLDAMDFNGNNGICIGDPIALDSSGKKYFYVITTNDAGESWQAVSMDAMPVANRDEEAIFSASGSNIFLFDKGSKYHYAFVTGGKMSHLNFIGKNKRHNKSYVTPVHQGIASAGVFSMAFDGNKNWYVVGGDYKQPNNTENNFAGKQINDANWNAATTPPNGYRSCIRWMQKNKLISCGTNGVDMSNDNGNNWMKASDTGFNVCMVSPNKKLVFFAGDKGRIGVLTN